MATIHNAHVFLRVSEFNPTQGFKFEIRYRNGENVPSNFHKTSPEFIGRWTPRDIQNLYGPGALVPVVCDIEYDRKINDDSEEIRISNVSVLSGHEVAKKAREFSFSYAGSEPVELTEEHLQELFRFLELGPKEHQVHLIKGGEALHYYFNGDLTEPEVLEGYKEFYFSNPEQRDAFVLGVTSMLTVNDDYVLLSDATEIRKIRNKANVGAINPKP